MSFFGEPTTGTDKVFEDCQKYGHQNCSFCTRIECCDSPHNGLKIFADDYTTIIAKNRQDAWLAYIEYLGDKPENYDMYDNCFEELVTIDLNKAHRMYLDEDRDVKIIKTWRRWIADNGRGFLSGTEY